MQTEFAPELLADPDMARSEKILRACVHCGFCSATCPTYLLTGDELDGPRGRIYLMKDMLEKNRPADARTVRHIDRCLSCLSCMTTCPSGVNYMNLVDHARVHIEKTYARPALDRGLRALLAVVMPNPRLFSAALGLGRLVRPLARIMPDQIAAMLALMPDRRCAVGAPVERRVYLATGPKRFRAILLAGCVQDALDANIHAATIAFLTRHGVEVVISPDVDCCGSLAHHLGKRGRARAAATRAISAWTREIQDAGADFIVADASGCGSTIKHYADMFHDDANSMADARRISSLASDVTEVAARLDLSARVDVGALRVAHQPPCSLQHGQRLGDLPAELLRSVGFDVRAIPESHLCCGSAGTYNILQPEMASRLRARKIEAIRAVACDVVASANIGCIMQIRSDPQAPPVVHCIELLNWATGGDRPRALKSVG